MRLVNTHVNFAMMVIQATDVRTAAVTPAAWIKLLRAWWSCLLVRHGSPSGVALGGVSVGGFRLELLLPDSKDK